MVDYVQIAYARQNLSELSSTLAYSQFLHPPSVFFRPFGTFLIYNAEYKPFFLFLISLHFYNFYSIYASIMDKKCFFYPLYLIKVDKKVFLWI